MTTHQDWRWRGPQAVASEADAPTAVIARPMALRPARIPVGRLSRTNGCTTLPSPVVPDCWPPMCRGRPTERGCARLALPTESGPLFRPGRASRRSRCHREGASATHLPCDRLISRGRRACARRPPEAGPRSPGRGAGTPLSLFPAPWAPRFLPEGLRDSLDFRSPIALEALFHALRPQTRQDREGFLQKPQRLAVTVRSVTVDRPADV